MRQDRLTRQEEGRITFAVLDTHWNRIQPFVEQYAVARGVQVDPRALEYDELYRHVSLALTQRAETFDVVSLSDTWIPQFAPFVTTMPPNDEQQAGLAPVADAAARYPLDANPCGLPWVGDVQFFAAWPGWLTAKVCRRRKPEHGVDGRSR
ncbi:MAG: hypothetical protein M9947_06040 [Thermomicrobiales bacterium]|nr:hypothetical protein [Thermomicrobiales bacterium]